jgi:hypothetical protein
VIEVYVEGVGVGVGEFDLPWVRTECGPLWFEGVGDVRGALGYDVFVDVEGCRAVVVLSLFDSDKCILV